MRLVCVGDSFTEGLADDLRPDGEYRGWADRVAQALAVGQPVEYANLAVRGKLLDQVVHEQLPIAADLAPDVLTFHAGGNDVLRRGTDLPDLFKRYDAAVAGIASPDRKVLLFTSISPTVDCGTPTGFTSTRRDTPGSPPQSWQSSGWTTAGALDGGRCRYLPSPPKAGPSRWPVTSIGPAHISLRGYGGDCAGCPAATGALPRTRPCVRWRLSRSGRAGNRRAAAGRTESSDCGSRRAGSRWLRAG